MTGKPTAKQEGYAQDRASGLDRSSAYRANYRTGNMAAKTVWEEACRLEKHPKVSARILELQAATETALAEKRLWDVERLVEEAEANLAGAKQPPLFIGEEAIAILSTRLPDPTESYQPYPLLFQIFARHSAITSTTPSRVRRTEG